VPNALSQLQSALAGRYQIEHQIGRGGMATVWIAHDLKHDRQVAIKVIRPEMSAALGSERFLREIRIAAQLQHPHILTLIDSGDAPDGESRNQASLYYVMPYVEGETLRQRLTREGRLSQEETVRILGDILDALVYAHRHGIIHRDIKPENIMLVPNDDGSDRAVVMDFGLAKERRADPSIAKLTATGIILGTPEFMSPEQIRGKALDARSDVYALGIVAFEMFTGKLPFQGRNAQEMMIARLRGSPTPIRSVRPDLPVGLEKAISKALETNPDNRFPTTLAFAEAMAEGESSGGGGGGLFGKLKERLK